MGRFRIFGTHTFSFQESLIINGSDETSWVRLSAGRSAKVHGLAIEVPKGMGSSKLINGFGVSQNASPPPGGYEAINPPPFPIHAMGPTLPSLEFIDHLQTQALSYGLSTASLNNVSTLHVRRNVFNADEERKCGFAGLRVAHHDATVEILGRWDPRDKDSISKIYDSSEGILTRVSFHLANIGTSVHVENITVGVTDNPLDVRPLDESVVVPSDPPNYRWNSTPADHPTALTNTRTFDCSQINQVSMPTTPLPLQSTGSKLLSLTTSSKRVAWWFTFDYDDIGRDHGSPSIQVKETTNLDFGIQYEAVQIE